MRHHPVQRLALLCLSFAVAACGDDGVSKDSDTGADTDSDTTVSDVDTIEELPDTLSPDLAETSEDDTASDLVDPDTSSEVSQDTTEPLDPDAASFVPGPWTAMRLPPGARFELLGVVLARPLAPSAEDELGFIAKVRTDALALTSVAELGEENWTIGERAATRDLLLGLSPSGELIEVSAGNPVERELASTAMERERCSSSSSLAAARNSIGLSEDGSTLEITPLAEDRPRQIYNGEKERPYIPIAKRSKAECSPAAPCPAPTFNGFASTTDGHEYAIVRTDGGLAVTWLNGVASSIESASGTAFVRIDRDPPAPSAGSSEADSFVKVVPDAELVAVLGGSSNDLLVLFDRPASAGETPRLTLERIDLGSGTEALAPPLWVCKDACYSQVSTGELCGTVDHFRGAGQGRDIVLTGVFSGTVDFGGGVVLTATGPANPTTPPRESFVLVLDENGNPRIGRKGGGMSIDRVGFSNQGDVILAGTFEGAAALGIEATAVGERDVWFGVFSKETLTPSRAVTQGEPEAKSSLLSDWLELEAAGECEATGAIGGFAVRTDELVHLVGVGENAQSCIGDPLPAGGGETRIVGHGGGMFFWLPDGTPITWGEPGQPADNAWPPIPRDWEVAAGYSRARVMRNSR